MATRAGITARAKQIITQSPTAGKERVNRQLRFQAREKIDA
jgi:hypothetical protein